jgi:hypothetical protein
MRELEYVPILVWSFDNSAVHQKVPNDVIDAVEHFSLFPDVQRFVEVVGSFLEG